MSFLHAWALIIGGTALAGPVVVHLLTRPRPMTMPLSTLRFVRDAIRQRRARHRLRDFLILALRTAAVLLLALALARPEWGKRPLVSGGQDGNAVRVVVLDVSQSMTATDGGIAAIERARTIAGRYLRYRPGLRANLVLAGAAPSAVFDQPSTNFQALQTELADCRVLPERIDVGRTLEETARLLALGGADDRARRELVVVSDFQRSNWAKADFSGLARGVQIQLESVAPAQTPSNLAILRATARATGSHGRQVQLEIEVGNFSPAPTTATVEATVGDSTWRREVTVPSGRRTVVGDQLELRQSGWQPGRAALVGVEDCLAADDSRPFVVRLRKPPVYALISRQAPHERPSSSHYLECALLPEAGQEENKSSRLLRLDPSRADATALAPADVIVMDHPGKLSEESVSLLAGLLRRGRPIIYSACEPIDARNLKLLAEAAGGGLQMPVEFLPPPAGAVRRDRFISSLARNSPVFSVFGDQLTTLTGGLRFAGGLDSRRLEDSLEDDVLAAYNDGAACLVLTSSDAGSLAVLNANLTASNLPKSPALVPLLEELVGMMVHRHGGEQATYCGEPLVARLPTDAGSAAELQICGPPDSQGNDSPGPCGELVDAPTGVVWRWAAPDRPGVYQCRQDDDNENIAYAVAINVPSEESELEPLPADVLVNRLAAGQDVHFRGTTDESRTRDDIWKWFAVACAICLLGEIVALASFRT